MSIMQSMASVLFQTQFMPCQKTWSLEAVTRRLKDLTVEDIMFAQRIHDQEEGFLFVLRLQESYRSRRVIKC